MDSAIDRKNHLLMNIDAGVGPCLKKRRMQAAMNLQGPEFSALFHQVNDAIVNHTHIYVGNDDEYAAIPAAFRQAATQRKCSLCKIRLSCLSFLVTLNFLEMNAVLGAPNASAIRAITVVLYRRLQSLHEVSNEVFSFQSLTEHPKVFSFESLTEHPNAVLVDAHGLHNRVRNYRVAYNGLCKVRSVDQLQNLEAGLNAIMDHLGIAHPA